MRTTGRGTMFIETRQAEAEAAAAEAEEGGGGGGDISSLIPVYHTARDISYAQVGTCDVLNGDMAGGWTLTPHHHYDLGGQTLFLGNGSVVKATPVKTPACVFSNIQISATGTLSIVSRDGAELYLFDADGRHLRTYDTLLGAVEYAFGYDANGRLISIVDKFSNTTSVQRAGSGEATNIVSPFGVRTQLLMDDNGYLSAVVNPANETNAFRYSANGLLTNVITRKGYVFSFVYDEWGRLVRAEDPAGAYHQFKRENFFAGHEVMDSGTLQGSNTYRFARMGADFSLRTHVAPGNLTTLTYQNYAETIITNIAPDGTVVSTLMGADPRFDWQVKKPEMRTIRFPSGLIWSANVSRAASLSDTGDVLSLVSFTNVFSINDRPAYVASYQASNRMASLTSPEGRTRRVIYNANGRAERIELPGLYPIDVAYDVHGRLQQFAIGTGAVRRAFGLGYTTNGFWGALTNSLLQSYRLDSDPAGRVTNLLQPDAKTIGLRYDKSSNLGGVRRPIRLNIRWTTTTLVFWVAIRPPAWLVWTRIFSSRGMRAAR
ncbi:MAG: hypothetical protein M5U15_03830 [Kiritimatiellae bacterium]|nr:hypothetical protein [Kiritimatiellia bacterium]